ncbi:hypothetical protein RBSWK_04645 [Rhodopirellula baltica SWK14]|uniref:Uncharacterized protein n=1 Tax=Rhodopirellula baltica SWK14 TaxID=993516 RepID=L7CB52_RHOBT|nr:hypothetical protein RBSWK_04645 [Rhodopirellula baltica SWK14]
MRVSQRLYPLSQPRETRIWRLQISAPFASVLATDCRDFANLMTHANRQPITPFRGGAGRCGGHSTCNDPRKRLVEMLNSRDQSCFP